MSRLLVIGASGGTGRCVLELGIARGHAMTALVRTPAKLDAISDRAHVVAGDPTRAADVAAAARAHDAVITALGAPGTGPTSIHAEGMRALVAALDGAAPRRAVMVSAAMLFQDAGVLAALLRNTVLRHVARDSRQAEALLTESALDWTVVRPPRLTHGARTGRWRVAEGHMPTGWAGALSRADLAECLLDEALRVAPSRRLLGVACVG
ncbi:MAG: NAD(P)H-binding protein [Sandaracinus sp.]